MDPRGSRSLNRPSKILVKNVTSGKVSRNPFINFLRDYRKSNKTNLKLTELTKRGAQLWRGMTDREKSPYINVSKQAPRHKQTRRRARRRKRRRRRRRGRRRRSRSRSRSPSSSVTSDSSRRRKKKDRDRENNNKKAKDDKRKERSTSSTKKPEKPSTVNDERNPVNNKKDDEYEVKYKNSRYEDHRDFI